jgi:archaellum biogenesis protein FlaJ (TadC family)
MDDISIDEYRDVVNKLHKEKANAIHIITEQKKLIKELLDNYWDALSHGAEPSNELVEKWSSLAEKYDSYFGDY